MPVSNRDITNYLGKLNIIKLLYFFENYMFDNCRDVMELIEGS